MSNALKVAAVGGAVSAETDPNFNQTVLLLHGDGTNGAQNNTFLDGSTNNFTITRNGNTTQGTFSPFSVGAGEWSNYMTSTTQWLSIANTTALDLPGDFTIEAWVFCDSTANRSHQIVGKFGTSAYAWLIGVNPSTGGFFIAYGNSGSYVGDAGFGTAFTPNQWVHVAVTRSGSTVRGFLNGVQQGSSATITSNLSATTTTYIGRDDTTTRNFSGYISNLRVVKGRAVYTSNFTPSTTPLGATSGGTNPPQGTETSLLTCQSNRFVDNSTNAFAITRNGDVKVTPFSPFAPTAAYSASTNGGSGYFDGNGDALVSSGASVTTSVAFGTGDFTVSVWYYPLSFSSSAMLADLRSANGASFGFLFVNTSGNVVFFDTAERTSSNALTLNAWNYITWSRLSGTIRVFIGTTSGYSSSMTSSLNGGKITVGGHVDLNSFWANGYISDLRILKGTGYSSVTIPTAPLTSITNTEYLLNFTNAGIFDSTAKNNLETVGNAQIDTTTKKYGTGSMEFDGTGDFLKVRRTPEFEFGSGDFTVEFWANANALSGAYTGVVGVWVAGSSVTANAWNITLNAFNGTNKFGFSYSNGSAGTDVIFNATTSTGSWDHYAVVRSGNTLYGFKNGVSQAISSGSSTITATITPGTVDLYIGTVGTASSGTDFNGFIDDLRITKGVARYTANFTAPTKAFPDQ